MLIYAKINKYSLNKYSGSLVRTYFKSDMVNDVLKKIFNNQKIKENLQQPKKIPRPILPRKSELFLEYKRVLCQTGGCQR